MLKPEDRVRRVLDMHDPACLKAIDDILLGKALDKMPIVYPLDSRIYSITGAASQLGLCRKSVYNLIHAGELAAIKVGGRYRVSGQAIREFRMN